MANAISFRTWMRQVLPPEHGSWAFVLEPCLIAIATGRGAFVAPAIGVFVGFLAFRPLMLGVQDLWRKKRFPRTMPSLIAGLILGAIAAVLVALSRNGVLIGSLALMGALFLGVNARAKPRSLLRELVGALVAVPLAVAAVPLAGVVLAVRPVVSVLAIRGYLARMPDAAACRWSGAIFGVLASVLAIAQLPTDALKAAYIAVGLRAIYLAITPKSPRTPVQLGIVEGLIAAAIVIAWAIA